MYTLQTAVDVNDRTYTITNKGDFRMVLDCMAAMRDDELSEDYKVLASLLIFYNEFNSIDDVLEAQDDLEGLVNAMMLFINCGDEEPQGAKQKHPLIDWEKDSNMICSAINKVAGTEVRALEYMHWWTFVGYYMAIGESTLATVVSIRSKIVNGKKLEKWEKEFKRENPDYFNWKHQTQSEIEADKFIREIWNSGE